MVLALWSIAVFAIRGSLKGVVVVAAIGVLGTIAVAEVPHGTDLWAYQSYGRIIEEYHANPYLTVPADIPGDPVLDRVIDMYRNGGSLYGPAFVLGAAVISAISGTGFDAGRLAWQSTSLAAAIGILILLRRRGVPWDRVLMVGISPVVAYLLIHQAHNDVLVGLLMVLGVSLAASQRQVWCAVAFSLAALVKAPAAITLIVYGVWLLARGDRRGIWRVSLTSLVLGATAVAPFGFRAVVEPLTRESGKVNATSIWNLVRGDAMTFIWRPVRSIETPAGAWLTTIALVIPVLLAVTAAWRMRMRPLHEPLTVALVAWVVFSLYPSVWMCGWFVALAALWDSRTSRILIGFSSLSLVTSQAWLLPVAALVERGSYGLVERSAALLLGLSTVAGLALLTFLLSKGDRELPVIRPSHTRENQDQVVRKRK